MKKNVKLGDKLHQEIKIASAKESMTMEAFIAKKLWAALGSKI